MRIRILSIDPIPKDKFRKRISNYLSPTKKSETIPNIIIIEKLKTTLTFYDNSIVFNLYGEHPNQENLIIDCVKNLFISEDIAYSSDSECEWLDTFVDKAVVKLP